MRPAVAARGLVRRYGSHVALRAVDVEVEPGEQVAVLGDNGAGKSTLLRVLATADRPQAGTLELFGTDALRRRDQVRPRLGWLAHQPGLYPALTALENLEFFCALHSVDRSRAAEWLERVGLEADAGRRAAELSRGRQQRLALARSLLHEPELWIVDEPDTGLDAAGRRLLDELGAGRTVLMSTHDRGLATRLCGRAIELRDGAVEVRPELRLQAGGTEA